MKKKMILAGALALCLTLSACGSQAPSQEEVEAAIEDGSITVEDALNKGWVTQEWVDSYMEENTVPAADKMAVNKVGEFETQTVTGDPFTNQDIPAVAFMVFLDLEDAGAQAYYDELVKAVEDVRAAGADIVVCSKGGMDAELYQDAPLLRCGVQRRHEDRSGAERRAGLRHPLRGRVVRGRLPHLRLEL